jgi:hypothetical protein
MENQKPVPGNVEEYSKVKSIKNVENEDVYCLTIPETGNFLANGMVIKNCDAMRYAVYTHYKNRESLIEKDRSQIYMENEVKKFNKDPMNYPGFPGQIGWQVIPNQFM